MFVPDLERSSKIQQQGCFSVAGLLSVSENLKHLLV